MRMYIKININCTFILDLDVKDYGDIVYKVEHTHENTKSVNKINNMTSLSHVASCTNRLSQQVQQILQERRQALTIGGDHSLSIGTIDAHVKV